MKAKWPLVILTILIVIRLLLPWILLRAVNEVLNSIPGYHGHAESVSVSLWRGAYGIYGVKLTKIHWREDEPFVSVNAVDIAVDWDAIWHRRLVTKIVLMEPQLQFIQRATAESSQTSIDESWQEKVKKLYPFEINRFLVSRGLVRYRDETKTPKVNLYIQDLRLEAENITNATRKNDPLPSSVAIQARVLDSGDFELRSDVNLLASETTANVKGALHHLALVNLNPFSQAYEALNFKGGELQVTFEVAATPTRYNGYIKTLFHGVRIFDWSKDKTSAGHLLWQGIAALIVEIFTNHRHDQFAARIPLDGPRADLKINKWSTAGSVLRNAFVKALSPKFEDKVQLKAEPRG